MTEIPWHNNGRLVGGRVPASTRCPYARECWFAKDGTCQHKGTDQKVSFHCMSARVLAALDHFSDDDIPIKVCPEGEEQ